jgi:Flp pilus assembly protein TadB
MSGPCARPDSDRVRRPLVSQSGKEVTVLSTLIIVLLILWLLGVVTAYTMGGLIHVLLVIAIVVMLVRVIQGRNPVRG